MDRQTAREAHHSHTARELFELREVDRIASGNIKQF